MLKNRFERGFTLIELMMVVAIIGLLAAAAIPTFAMASCRTRQAEAKGGLKGLFTSMESYRAENDVYPQAVTEAELQATTGFSIKGKNRLYSFATVVSPNGLEFTATATGLLTQTGDLWTMTEKNDMTEVSNSCY